MKKDFIVLCMMLSSVLCFQANAETKEQRKEMKHEVRIGWGDQMFESLAWRNPQFIVNNTNASDSYNYKENYRYTQHLFAEYQYRLNSWFGVGGMLDVSSCMWDNVKRNGLGQQTATAKNQYFANIVIMPTARFTYCSTKHFNLYSGLGVGLNINTGTETDGYGRHTVMAPAINLTGVGASFNYKQWFAAVELGGMISLSGKDYIYMLGSRMISASIGMRF